MKKLSIILAIFMTGVIGIALLFVALGFRVNLTDSIPVGLYRITGTAITKNSFVIFCPDDRPAFRLAMKRDYISSGLCPGGYGYLMKKVVATQGDIVPVINEGVFVNYRIIPFSKPKLIDEMNRFLPQWKVFNYRLKENELLTMTTQSEWSFDGRYYGLIRQTQVMGVIMPISIRKLENYRK